MTTMRAKIRAFWHRLSATVLQTDGAGELDAELEAHVAMDTEAGVKAGLDAAEARRQALLRLGGAEQTRQAYRERRGLLWIENFAQDLRYGLRTLRRTPGFTVTAVLTLGLGHWSMYGDLQPGECGAHSLAAVWRSPAPRLPVYAESEPQDSTRSHLSCLR